MIMMLPANAMPCPSIAACNTALRRNRLEPLQRPADRHAVKQAVRRRTNSAAAYSGSGSAVLQVE